MLDKWKKRIMLVTISYSFWFQAWSGTDGDHQFWYGSKDNTGTDRKCSIWSSWWGQSWKFRDRARFCLCERTCNKSGCARYCLSLYSSLFYFHDALIKVDTFVYPYDVTHMYDVKLYYVTYHIMCVYRACCDPSVI